MTRPVDRRRHLCRDCGVRLYNGHRATKHRGKTGHQVVVDLRAELAHAKYKASLNPDYLTLLDQKIASDPGDF